jgi:hypothetical protein
MEIALGAKPEFPGMVGTESENPNFRWVMNLIQSHCEIWHDFITGSEPERLNKWRFGKSA